MSNFTFNLELVPTTLINRHLKFIGEYIGVENITTHCARHSFAYPDYTKNPNIKAMQQVLGHSDVSITQNYIDELTGDSLDNYVDNIFND